MIEKGLVTEIEPFEDVVVENPPHDWESSCDKYKTWNCIFSNIFKIVGSFLFLIAVLDDVIIIHIVVVGIDVHKAPSMNRRISGETQKEIAGTSAPSVLQRLS